LAEELLFEANSFLFLVAVSGEILLQGTQEKD
jgi:hypothetical protein